MDITKQVIERAAVMLGVMLQNYNSKINTAYLDADDELKVGLSLQFKPEGSGVGIKAEIKFIESQVKDSIKDSVREAKQIPLEFSAKAGRPVVKVGTTPGARCRARWYQHR